MEFNKSYPGKALRTRPRAGGQPGRAGIEAILARGVDCPCRVWRLGTTAKVGTVPVVRTFPARSASLVAAFDA